MEQFNLSLKKYILFLIVFFSSGLALFAQDAGPDQPGACASTNLAATTVGGIWTTAGGATIDDPTDPNTLVSNLDLGDNVFTWTVGAATDDVTIVNNEIIADAGPDQPLACVSSVLAGSNPTPGTGTWTASAGGVNFDNPNSPTANVSNLPIGPVTLTWTIDNGACSNADDMVITNNTPPVVNAGADNEACTNNSIQLGGNDPAAFGGTGIWSIVTSAGTFTDETLYNTWVTGMNPDLNEFQWTVTRNGCSDNDRVIITNNTVVATASNQEVCGTTATLDGNDPAPLGATGLWAVVSSAGVVTTPAQHDSGVTGMNAGVNQFNWELSKGTCTDDITITITNNAVVADAGPDQPALCADNTTLAGNTPGGSTGSWSVGGIGSGNITTLTLSNTTVTNLGSDWNEFVWTVTQGVCSDNDAVQIQNVVPTPSNAGLPQSVCGTATTLAANAPGPGANFAGLWSVVSGGAISFVDNADQTTDIDGLNPGDNILNWRIYSTVDNNCWSESQVTITNTTLNANAGPDQHVCGTTATMDGSSPGAGTGLWSLISGSGVPTIPTLSNTVVTGLGNGPNTFEWTVTGGACSGSDQVVIYNDIPSVAAAGADDESCDGTYGLLGNNPVTGTGVWSSLAAGPVFANNTVFNTTVSGLNANTNTLTWTITNGACTDADDVIITNNTVTPPNAGPDQPDECKDVFTLAAIAPTEGTGLWSIASGTGIFVNDTQANTVVTNVGRGDNILRWTVTKGGCFASDDVVISNYSVIADAGFDDYSCDATYILSATDATTQNIISPPIAATGTWTALPAVPAIAFSDINDNDATVSNLVADGNTLTWTVDNGICSDVDQVVISNDMPTPANAGNDDIFCGIDFDENGEGYTELYNSLQGNTPDGVRGETGVWTIVAGGATFVDPSNTPQARVTDLDHYSQLTGPDYWNQNPTINTFRWTITYKNCSLYDEVSIVNAAPFAADAGVDQTVCYDEANLNALDHGWGAQTHFWSELNPGNSGAIITRSNEFNAYVQGLQMNQTTFRWTKSNTLTFAGTTLTCTVYDDMIVDRPYSNTARPNAGPNQIVCSTEADMQAASEDIGFPATDNVTGTWSVILGNASFDDINSHSTHTTNIAYRRNVLRWTVNNLTQGCIATDDVDITNALPSNANAGPDQYVCTNTALLSADRPTRGTGEWSVTGGGGTISSTSCQNFSCNTYVSNMGTGENTFMWTMSNTYTDPASGDTKTCILTDEISVWNNEVTAEAGLDQTICIDDATLAATQPGAGETGVWSRTGGSGTVTTPSAYNTGVTTLSPNINTFRWRLSNAYCSDEDYMTITNNNPTDPVASTPITDICSDTAPINGNNPINGTGLWSVSAGGGVITDPSMASTTVTNMPRNLINTYTWTITKNGCPESADVTIYNRSVTAVAGTDIDDICGVEPAISTVNLAATQPNTIAGESGNWTVVSSAGIIVTPTDFDTQVDNMDNGTNTFRWTISNATCSDVDEVDAFVYIPTTSVTNPDREVCADLTDIEVLTANAPAPGRGDGTWTLVSGGGAIADITSNITTVTNLGKNENRFRWTIDHNNCTSINDIILTNNFVYADAGPDQAICVGTATLAANDPTVNDQVGLAQASGRWIVTQGAGVFVNDTQYDTNVSGLSTAVDNILTWTVSKGGCGDTDDVTIINNEFTITAGVDQTVCDNWTVLNGQQPGATGTGLWTVIGGGGSFVTETLYNTRVNTLSVNPNTFRWTITRNTNGNCTAFDDVIVYNNKVESNAGVLQRICVDNTNLNGNLPQPSGATGVWTATLGGASITTPTSNVSGVTSLANGQNTFEWTISRTMNGVTCTDATQVDIYNDTPSNAVVEADKEVCNNSSTLNVTTIPIVGTGVWSALDNAASIDNISSFNANVTGLNRGVNTFRWTVTNQSCDDIADLVITNNEVVSVAGVDKSTACADFTTLSGNDPTLTQGTGLWLDLTGTTATIVNNTLYSTSITGLEQGTTQFQWAVSLGSCSESSVVRITNNQITATAGVDQVTCNDFYAPLDGNDVSGVGGTGLWTSIGNTADITDATAFNTGVTSLDPGLNTFRWTVTSGAESCTDFAEVGITNNGVTANAGTDIETCNSTISLSATQPTKGAGIWTQSSGNPATIVDNTSRTSQINGLTGGVYAFTWTVTEGTCSDPDNVVVTNSSPSVSNPSTVSPEICNNADGTLNANALLVNETGLWTKVDAGGTINDPTNPNTTVAGLQLGDNTFRWTISKGTNVTCRSSADVLIVNNTVVAAAGPDQDICSASGFLAGNNPDDTQGNGVWTRIGAHTASIADITLYNTAISNLADNTSHGFTWTVSQGTCTDTDDIYVLNSNVAANAGVNQGTCDNFINLNGNDVSSTGAQGIWTKLPISTASIAQPTLYSTQVTALESGINVFTWTVTSTGGCVDFDEVDITYNEVLSNAGFDQEICTTATDLAATAPTAGSGVWSQVSGSAVTITDTTDPASNISGLSSGNYSFRWTVTSNGCSTSDDMLVVNSSPQTAVATTSTPEICGGMATLGGTAPGLGETGLWTLTNATGVVDDPTAFSTTVAGLKPGPNVFRWTLTKGGISCTSWDEVTILNNEVTANAFTSNNISCDATATISGNDPSAQSATGLWTVSTGATISNDTYYNNISATNLAQGDNIFTWTLSKGACSASATVTVTNNEVFAIVGGNIDVCGTTATLNGVDPSGQSATGLWTLEASDSPGVMIATPTLYNTGVSNITKTATFRWTVTGASCEDYDFVTVNNNSITVNDGATQTICSSDGTLNAGSLDAGQTGLWTAAGSNPIIANSTNPVTAVTNLDYGTNIFYWTVTTATGCSGSGRHDIINDSPSTPNAGVDQPLCSTTGTLSANTPLYGTGVWTASGGGPFVVISDPTNSSTTVLNLGTGDNTFTWTITNNACVESDDVILTNNLFPVTTGIDKEICVDNDNLSVVDGLGGVWTKISGTGIITDSTDPNTAVTNLSFGQNRFQWTVTQNGCTVFDLMNVTNNSPETPITEADKTVCQSDNVPITANLPSYGSGLWTAQGGTATIVDPTSSSTFANNLINGPNTLRWTLSYSGCSEFNDLVITSNTVTASAGGAQTLCADNTALAAVPPAVGTGSWSVTSGSALITDSTDPLTTVISLDQGDNIFRWTVVNGVGADQCTDFEEVTITNNSPDIANAGADISTCLNTEVLAANNPLVGSGVWSTLSSTATIAEPTLYNTSVTVQTNSSETFTWTITNNGCTSTDDMNFTNNSFVVNTGPDDYTCDGTYSLLGTNPTDISGTATGTWTVISGAGIFDNSQMYNATVSSLPNTGSRESILRWTITDNSCSAFSDIRITNDEVTVSASGFMTCNSNANILGNDPSLQAASGLWTLPNPNGQIISVPSSYTTSVSNLTSGINQFQWTVTRNACSESVIIDVEYYVPNANITISDIAHSCNDVTALTADAIPATGNGQWSLKFGSPTVTIDDNSVANTMARNLEIGDNIFVWTINDRGCTSTDEVSINNSMPINSDGFDQAACSNTFNMNAQEPTVTGRGLWTVVSSSGIVVFADNTLATTQVTVPYGNNILKWTIDDNGCTAEKIFNIDNNLTNPIASDGDTVKVCRDEVQLSGSQPATGETGVWTIDGSAGSEVFDNASIYNPIVTNLRKGQITFRWTVSNANCTDYDLAVVVNNTPFVDAGSDRTICEDNINLAGNIPGVNETGLWTIGSTVVVIDSDTKYNTPVSNLGNTNTFTWTIDNGICTNSDEVVITSRAIDVSAGLAYQEACADTLSLEATSPADVGSGTGTGTWSAIEGSGTFDNTSSYLTIGRDLRDFNKLRWTIVDNGCTYWDDIEFVSLLPTEASTGVDKAVCDNFTQITGQQPNYALGEAGLWTVASGTANITEPTAFQTQVTSLNLGTNIFKWTISNSSCSDSDFIIITNNQVFADAGTDQPNVCDSSSTISANVISGTGFWMTTSATAVIENSLAATTNVTQLSFGANNFQWIITNNGCTKVDEVTITSILPRNVSAGADQDICTGTANLAGSNPGIGTGLWTLTGGAGTFADDTANQTTVRGLATGDNLFTWTVTVRGCSENSQVRISNNSIDVSAGTDATICNQNSLTLDGTIPGTGVVGTWSVQGGAGIFGNNSVYNTDVSGFTKGTNSYRWTLDDGNCINYADVVVTNNTPDVADVGPDQNNLCVDYTTISAIPVSVGVGIWTVKSGNGTIVNPTSNNTDVTGINNGTNTFTWTVTKNGCSLAADINVTNNSVDAYIADKNVVICTDTHTATIIGNAPLTGQTGFWAKQNAGDAGIIVSTASNVTSVTNLANGDTYFTWTIENGSCNNSDDVRVTNNYYNTTANPGGPPVLCEDYSPIIGGTPPAGGTGLWSSTAPDVTFDSDTKVSTIVRNLPGGTTAITWTVTKDGCLAPASFNLVNNAIYTSAGENQIVCQNSTNMNAQALLVGESGRWTVDNALVLITDTSDPTTAVSDLIPGNNTFTWTLSANNCTATDVVVVSDNSFSVTAGNDDIACGTLYNLAASDPLSGTGLWTVSSGTGRFANASNYQTAVLDMDNGVNTFTWTVNRNGCEDADDVAITNNLYIAVAGEDRAICSAQTTVSAQPLNPTWGASGLWTAQTGGGVFANPSSESTLVSSLASGDNRLRWTITKTESGQTCTSYDEIVITNNSITASAGTDETTCDNFATLSATPLSATGNGLWSGGGVYTVIVDPSSATTLVTDLQQGTNTFAWTVSDKGCTGTSTVKVTSNYFVADAGASQVVTVNSTVMTATLPDATATGTWSIFSGNGNFVDVTNPNETVTALGFGINTFRWTVSWSSCTAYDDVDITYNAISAEAGPQQVICTDETYLAANNPSPGIGVWSIISGSAAFDNVNDPNTRVSGIQPGSVNIFRWTVEIGGYSEYDDVTVLNSEFTISAGSDKEECYNTSTMTAESAGAGNGTWSVLAGGGNFANSTLNNTDVTNIAEGINLFVWTVVKNTGCVNSDTVQVVYNLPPTAGFDMDQSAGCTPIDVTFTNTSVNGQVYYWNFGDDFRTDSSLITFTRTYEALYDKDSTYNVQLVAESAKGCYDTIVQQVTTYRIPLVGFSATPISQLFPRSEITIENLSGDGYVNYYWDMDDGNTYLHSSMVESFSHKYDSWGEYTITLSVFSNNCSDTARQTVIIVAPQPVTTIKPGLRAKGCEDLSVYFEAFVNYADTFHWDFGDGGTSEEQDPTYIYDTPGTYIVTLSASGPGTDTLIVVRRDTVQVFEVPIADFEAIPDTVMLPNQPVILHNNSISADKYQWNFGSSDPVSTEKSPTHYYTEEGIYTITLDVWTNNGCHDSKSIENAVVVEPAGTFQFPSAINPYSKTEINRMFKPKHRGIREYKLEIYNRWGEKVFESTDPEVGWGGYIDGKVGAQDVYVWKVSGKYKNGILFKKTGDVTLLR